MIIERWWPTPIWTDNVHFDTSKVASKCLRLREEGFPNREFSNVGGWQSRDINLDAHEEFHIIRDIIKQKTKDVCASISETFVCRLGNIWVNINDRDCRNDIHRHPGSTISGTIYLQTDENCGNIVFYNVDSPMKHYTFLPGEKCNFFYDHVKYRPKNGMIIFFPSWLSHEVEPSGSDIPRISMSFNLTQRYEGL